MQPTVRTASTDLPQRSASERKMLRMESLMISVGGLLCGGCAFVLRARINLMDAV